MADIRLELSLERLIFHGRGGCDGNMKCLNRRFLSPTER